MFSSVTAISAPIFDTERMLSFQKSFFWGLFVPVKRIWGERDRERIEQADLYLRWRNQEDLKGLSLMIAWGDDDRRGVIRTNEAFTSHLDDRGIDYAAVEYEGGHNWKSWTPVIEQALRKQVGLPSANRLGHHQSGRPSQVVAAQ